MHHHTIVRHDYEHVVKNGESIVKAGSEILTCKPFAYSLQVKFSGARCDTCFRGSEKENTDLSRCGKCHWVYYCNKECQKQGWVDGHKFECKGFCDRKSIPGPFTRILLRVITKIQNRSLDHYDKINFKTRRRFRDLMSHYSDITKDSKRMEELLAMGKCVECLLKHCPKIIMPSDPELLAICGRIFINTFSITDYEGQTLGCGLYLGASIFDNSCEPIAIPNFESTTITIRLIKDIPINLPIDKITISYKDVLRPSEVRKAELAASYYFDCQCERCGPRMYDDIMNSLKCPTKDCSGVVTLTETVCKDCHAPLNEKFVEDVKEIEEMCKEHLSKMVDVAYLDASEACLRQLKSKNFCDNHWLTVNMAIAAFDASVDLGNWHKAYLHGSLALKGQRMYLDKNHPTFGICLLKMAKLCWYLEKDEEAEKYIVEAKSALKITHGPNSTFYMQNVAPLLAEMVLCSKSKAINLKTISEP